MAIGYAHDTVYPYFMLFSRYFYSKLSLHTLIYVLMLITFALLPIFSNRFVLFPLLQDYAVSRLKNYQYLKEKIMASGGSPTIDNDDTAEKITVD